jgi:hypothetical protein
LVRHRRFAVIRRLLFLPCIIFIGLLVVLLPVIFFVTPLAALLFFIFLMGIIVVVHSYLYTLYRELLSE